MTHEPRSIHDLPTPALVADAHGLAYNLDTMAAARPGTQLRPHVKAHKCTALARLQYERGHTAFTCATVREVEGMVAAGLGDDLLLANELLDATRLGRLAESGARVTLTVDSPATVEAAAAAGLREVLIDVNVGMPRCGCSPDDAPRIAESARSLGLEVRGVMGYEGHVVGIESSELRAAKTEECMTLLRKAHDGVGGEVVSAGGTGTYSVNTWATEIQAGSYALMDAAYGALEQLPFREALTVVATVIHVNDGWAVADAGLKALSMDHGNPPLGGDPPAGDVWFYSDEHVTFGYPEGRRPATGDRVCIRPAHGDPTIAKHERLHLVDGDEILDIWEIDLRGW